MGFLPADPYFRTVSAVNALTSDCRQSPAFAGFQTVDKALLLQGFAIVGTAFLI